MRLPKLQTNKQPKQGRVRVCISLPPDLATVLKQYAQVQQCNTSEFVRGLLKAYMEYTEIKKDKKKK